jgi:hypothetical protein
MRKLIMSIAFAFMFSSLSFGNATILEKNHETIATTLTLDNILVLDYLTIVDEYDICTVTVTVRTSCGSYSATASNNQANCSAAREAAYDHAMMIAGAMCGIP